MSEDEGEIQVKRLPLYFVVPEVGTTLYSWGTITNEIMTRAEYDERFGAKNAT